MKAKMQLARTVEEAAGFCPSVLTIGKFDGVHSGHAWLLRQVIALARERNLRPSALTFDPHPACVVAPERAPRPLIPLEERCERIQELGIEQLFVLHFTAEIARLTPEEFVERFVHGVMQARIVLVGENFRFGYKQAGDPVVLRKLGERFGFEVRVVEPVRRRGRIVSTSEIRRLIEAGLVSKACRLLGRPYALSGDIVHGFGIGAKQTVPTLNLRPPAEALPGKGVYISRTDDLTGGRHWDSITNVGIRPTFGGGELSIETYLLDPLEGPAPSAIRVQFLKRVREERKFENPEALKRQILSDVARAQEYFRRRARLVSSEVT
ncbi:MAG TPA: bifunctional riboflavin kinase/FAD synthetase [Bryobacteraceae bacterium]|nr:bifunctional riboflavin kinase/FAD synthetase [Bryobacteraceae bacterium]